eukprot:scaffold294692_cov19-Tisochrysis_lutea.AAC.1
MAASEAAGFVNDLVLWIDFHQSNREPGTRASCDACKLQQLKELGMGLLNHSLCCDLVGIAGITERAAEVMKWLLPGKLLDGGGVADRVAAVGVQHRETECGTERRRGEAKTSKERNRKGNAIPTGRMH